MHANHSGFTALQFLKNKLHSKTCTFTVGSLEKGRLTSSVFTATLEIPAAVCAVDGHIKTVVNVDAVVARVADYRPLLIPDAGWRGRHAVGVVANFQPLVNVDPARRGRAPEGQSTPSRGARRAGDC